VMLSPPIPMTPICPLSTGDSGTIAAVRKMFQQEPG
jgi:hypothetical protein